MPIPASNPRVKKMSGAASSSSAPKGTRSLIGLMVESYLEEGAQPFPKNPAELRYGLSITDGCVGWETTERMLRWGHKELGRL
jgi:phospho-2-dehydro-3-deoxyheptonate aldolase